MRLPIAAPCPVCGVPTRFAEHIVLGGETLPLFGGVAVERASTMSDEVFVRFDLPCGHSAGGYVVQYDLAEATWLPLAPAVPPTA